MFHIDKVKDWSFLNEYSPGEKVVVKSFDWFDKTFENKDGKFIIPINETYQLSIPILLVKKYADTTQYIDHVNETIIPKHGELLTYGFIGSSYEWWRGDMVEKVI